jgi:hypothetical protein
MTFEEYWAGVEKLKALPNTAIKQLPSSLSAETKRKLMMLGPEKTVGILVDVIDEVNYGSVESIDSLVRKTL